MYSYRNSYSRTREACGYMHSVYKRKIYANHSCMPPPVRKYLLGLYIRLSTRSVCTAVTNAAYTASAAATAAAAASCLAAAVAAAWLLLLLLTLLLLPVAAAAQLLLLLCGAPPLPPPPRARRVKAERREGGQESGGGRVAAFEGAKSRVRAPTQITIMRGLAGRPRDNRCLGFSSGSNAQRQLRGWLQRRWLRLGCDGGGRK